MGTSAPPAVTGPNRAQPGPMLTPCCGAWARTNTKPLEPAEKGSGRSRPRHGGSRRGRLDGTSGAWPRRPAPRSVRWKPVADRGKTPGQIHVHAGRPAARPPAPAAPGPRGSGSGSGRAGTGRAAGCRVCRRARPAGAGTADRALGRRQAREDDGHVDPEHRAPAGSGVLAAAGTPPRICPAPMDRPGARRGPSVVAWRVARTCGSMRAQAAPWTVRAATRPQASGRARRRGRRGRRRPSRRGRPGGARGCRRRGRRGPAGRRRRRPYPPTASSSRAGPALRSCSIEDGAALTMKTADRSAGTGYQNRGSERGIGDQGAGTGGGGTADRGAGAGGGVGAPDRGKLGRGNCGSGRRTAGIGAREPERGNQGSGRGNQGSGRGSRGSGRGSRGSGRGNCGSGRGARELRIGVREPGGVEAGGVRSGSFVGRCGGG